MRDSCDSLNRLTQYKQGAINNTLDDTKGHWTLDGQKWTLGPTGNQLQVEQWQSSAFVSWWQNTPNQANEYVTRKTRADRNAPVHVDLFSSNTAANFDLPPGASDTFSVNPGADKGISTYIRQVATGDGWH